MATKATVAASTYSITMRGLLPARALKTQQKVTAAGATTVVTGLLTNRGNALVDGEQVAVDMPPVFLRFRDAAGKAALATKGNSWVLVEVSGWIAPLGAPEVNERGFYEVPSAMIIVDKLQVIKCGEPLADA